MKKGSNTYSIGITILVVVILVFFYLTLNYRALYEIATDGFYTDVAAKPGDSLPWKIALALAGLVLLLFFITKGRDSSGHNEEVEEGVRHSDH